jgi:uncharacterized protein (DUF1800 family)
MNRRTFLQHATGLGTLELPSTSEVAQTAQVGNTFATPQSVRRMIATRRGISQGSGGAEILSTTLKPWAPTPAEWDIPAIHHLFRRAGFSATMAEILDAKSKTPGAVVDALLDNTLLGSSKMPPLPGYAGDWLHVPPYLGNDPIKIQNQQSLYETWNLDLRRWWTVTMTADSTKNYYAPLRERMLLFWSNHFVVESQKVEYPQAMYAYMDYLRKNAWGNFKQMVKDITISPAMLIYLDGTLSVANAPNENYGRELQELFTMGPLYKDGTLNYTEDDIKAVARALTGYYVDAANPAPDVVVSKYDPARHNSTPINPPPYGAALGNYGLTSSGASGIIDIIDLMFSKRADAIANYVCTKLYQHFVFHEIGMTEQVIIDQMAATFKNGNWELKPVLVQLLKSEHFFDPIMIGSGIKGPYDHAVGIIRMFGVTVDEFMTGTLYYYMLDQGQKLLDPPNVKGWPGFHTWLNTTSLPLRNSSIATPFVYTSIPTVNLSKDGHGNLFTEIKLTDTALTTWAKQFPNYDGQLDQFVLELATYLCATQPSAVAIAFVMLGFSYDWATLHGLDKQKLPAIRAIVSRIMLLSDFQLM